MELHLNRQRRTKVYNQTIIDYADCTRGPNMGTNKGKKGAPRNGDLHTQDELKEYQARFQVLFDHVCSGVAIYEARNGGEDFVFVDFNPAAEQIEHIKSLSQ